MGQGSQAAQGALGGASTGAAIGTAILPGWGTAIGAVGGGIVGGLSGWFSGDGSDDERRRAMAERNYRLQGGDDLRNFAQGQYMNAQGRRAPMARGSQLAGADQYQTRSGQMALAQQMAAVANGQQAGAGELAVNRQAHAAAANQFAAQNMARGSNAATAARNAAGQLGDIGTNASGMAQGAALQDQTNARGQLSGLYEGMRGQDIGFASQNAQLAQQLALANQNATLQQRGMNDSYANGMFGNYANVSQAELNARLARAGLLSTNANQNQFGANLMQMGGTMGAAYFNSRGGGGNSGGQG